MASRQRFLCCTAVLKFLAAIWAAIIAWNHVGKAADRATIEEDTEDLKDVEDLSHETGEGATIQEGAEDAIELEAETEIDCVVTPRTPRTPSLVSSIDTDMSADEGASEGAIAEVATITILTGLRRSSSNSHLELTAKSSDLECYHCHIYSGLWRCLVRSKVRCGRYVSKHTFVHWEQTGHRFAFDLDDVLQVWDYARERFFVRKASTRGSYKDSIKSSLLSNKSPCGPLNLLLPLLCGLP